MNRFKSWALWLSVAGAVWTILSAFGVTESIGLTESTFKTVDQTYSTSGSLIRGFHNDFYSCESFGEYQECFSFLTFTYNGISFPMSEF